MNLFEEARKIVAAGIASGKIVPPSPVTVAKSKPKAPTPKAVLPKPKRVAIFYDTCRAIRLNPNSILCVHCGHEKASYGKCPKCGKLHRWHRN